jgi:hypothetical protein
MPLQEAIALAMVAEPDDPNADFGVFRGRLRPDPEESAGS